MWRKSGLKKGCRVRIPESILISGSEKRFVRAEYVSETRSGILLKLIFQEEDNDDEWSYDTFINWSSIYCGSIKLKTVLGNDIHAVYENERRFHNGYRNKSLSEVR